MRGEKPSRIEAKVVIDAEGVGTTLLRGAHLPTFRRSAVVVGAQGYSRVSGVEPKSVEVYLDSEYAPGFFAWIIPLRDGNAKIGLATNRGNPRRLIEQFCRHHPKASKKISGPLRDISLHPIPLGGPPSKTYGNGLIVAGDAASQVKPITGGGVVFGLTCSEIAGNTAAEAVHVGDCSSRFLSKYQRLWRKKLGREFMIGRFTRQMIDGLSNRAIDRLFSIAKRLDVEDSFGCVSDIDFEEEILRYSLRKPNLAFAAVCSLLSYLLP